MNRRRWSAASRNKNLRHPCNPRLKTVPRKFSAANYANDANMPVRAIGVIGGSTR